MVHDVCYHQPCPVCGRTLQIGVMLLGRHVYCQHCGGGFVAADPALGRAVAAGLERGERDAAVDRLLERAAIVLEQAAR
jgi:hypothetical protein